MNKHRTNTEQTDIIHAERKPNSDTIVSSPNCLCAPRHSWLPLYNLRQSTSLRRGERGLETPSALSWCPQSKEASYWWTYARRDSVHYPQHLRVSSTISSNGPKLGIRRSLEWVAIRLDSFGRGADALSRPDTSKHLAHLFPYRFITPHTGDLRAPIILPLGRAHLRLS